MQLLISIIIPCYNRAHFLGETLDSILNQTYSNWECILVDDGSSDYTSKLLEFYCEKDSRIQFHHRPKNRRKGANACRNYGFELSKGKYVNWFDSDDIMHEEKLELQMNLIKNSRLDFVVCKTFAFEGRKENIIGFRHENLDSKKPFLDYLKMKIGWMTSSVLWNREFLLKIQYLFDEELKAAQEWEFHLRILSSKPNYMIMNKPLDFHRKHSSSITYNKNKNERFLNYFLARLKVSQKLDGHLDYESEKFLQQYLVNGLKKMIRDKNPHSNKAIIKFLLPDKKLSKTAKLYAFLSVVSYRYFNKGNFFLQKIKFS